MQRRHFLHHSWMGMSSLGLLSACAGMASPPSKAQVLVVGGGFGGATAAKYVRAFSNYQMDVVLIEPQAEFVSCPMSNLVLGGSKTMKDITTPYTALESQHGVKRVRDRVGHIDSVKKTVTLASGATIAYDKLILSPGIDFMWDAVEGLKAANEGGQLLQAWKAGPETLALRQQLEAMPDGGVFAIAIPEAPYRCPPGPYERACQVASYFKKAKPRSKVLVLDANPDVTSKAGLFKKAWAEDYKGMVEYRPMHKALAVDAATRTVQFEVQNELKADVLNVLPPMRAGTIAQETHLTNANGRWCNVDYLSFESTVAKDIHVIGDAIQTAPLMPKSGHMANSQAKVAAAAVVAQLSGWGINPQPLLTNTCYSFVSDTKVVHVATVHQYDAKEKTFKTVPGSGGVSSAANEQEAVYAWDWAQNIWADTLL